MVDSNCESSDSKTIRHSVFALLKENPSFSPKMICAKLHLSYVIYGGYINNLKSYWKSHYQFERGSNCSSVHFWHGWCCVPSYVDRDLALKVGWERTKAKNRWILWRDKSKIGRMMWFESGRVNLYVRSPVHLGRVNQLICNGFSFTDLILDDKIMQKVLTTIHPSGAHYVFEIGYPLPKKTIKYFEKSHGLTIKIGDTSHPKAVEVESSIPEWAEKLTLSLERSAEIFGALGTSTDEKDPSKRNGYVV
jgi:hypothetical protein